MLIQSLSQQKKKQQQSNKIQINYIMPRAPPEAVLLKFCFCTKIYYHTIMRQLAALCNL